MVRRLGLVKEVTLARVVGILVRVQIRFRVAIVFLTLLDLPGELHCLLILLGSHAGEGHVGLHCVPRPVCHPLRVPGVEQVAHRLKDHGAIRPLLGPPCERGAFPRRCAPVVATAVAASAFCSVRTGPHTGGSRGRGTVSLHLIRGSAHRGGGRYRICRRSRHGRGGGSEERRHVPLDHVAPERGRGSRGPPPRLRRNSARGGRGGHDGAAAARAL
mmetsp:Transcript_27277/g.55831  ORF Transcript_27277/g.55831 Transcript_27277/m.55831 type:complete len:216 (-) Transcript_27277:42-689(-)